jgi:energy-coupling factor transport system permease protein
MAASFLGLFVVIWGLHYGYGQYTFYPRADFLIKDRITLINLSILLFYLSVPIILSEGWKTCRFLKLKI